MTDHEVRQVLEDTGLCAVEAWWKTNLPRFRKLVEAAQQEMRDRGARLIQELMDEVRQGLSQRER